MSVSVFLIVNADMHGAGELSLQSQAGELNIRPDSLMTASSLLLQGETVDISGSAEAGGITVRSDDQTTVNGVLQAVSGDLQLAVGSLQAGSASRMQAAQGSVNVSAQDAVSLAEVLALGDIVVHAELGEPAGGQGIDVNGSLTSENGTVSLVADGGAPIRLQNAVVHARAGAIEVSGGDVTLGVLKADGLPEAVDLLSEAATEQTEGEELGLGSISIVSTGQISDTPRAESSPVALQAYRLDMKAATGIGSNVNHLDTQVTSLLAENSESGDIYINNIGELYVRGLWTYGNIDLINSNDVLVTNGSINALYGETLPLGDSMPADGLHFRLNIPEPPGSLIMQGTPDPQNPAISARSADILTSGGDFAGLGLPPSIYAPKSLLIIAARSWSAPIWGFGVESRPFTDESIIKTNINDVGAGEQLVTVESLEEIDPAVFTPVKNYLFSDVSILLPRDQRYDIDDDDEDDTAGLYGF